jgi:hypothetical protein
MELAKIKSVIEVLIAGNKELMSEAKEKYRKKHVLDDDPLF